MLLKKKIGYYKSLYKHIKLDNDFYIRKIHKPNKEGFCLSCRYLGPHTGLCYYEKTCHAWITGKFCYVPS
jgi:hypothetical protein